MEQLTRENIKQCKTCSGIYHFCVGRHHYIGSSVNVRARLKNHIWSMENNRHRNRIIQNCYNKYSLKEFYFEVIEYCSKDQRIEREKYYIDKLHPDLNVTDPVSLKRGKLFSQHISDSKRKYYETHVSKSRIPVYQYSITGDYIAEYSCATDVANLFNIEVSAVTAATNGRSKTCKGFQWRKEKYEKIDSLIKEKPKKIKSNLSSKPGNRKRIYRYSFDGEYIDSFESASAANKALGIRGSSAAAREDSNYRSVGGFQWSYQKVERMPKYENHSKDSKKKAIIIFDTKSNLTWEFDSIASAVRSLFPDAENFASLCAIISGCARGRANSFNGHYKAEYK